MAARDLSRALVLHVQMQLSSSEILPRPGKASALRESYGIEFCGKGY
jgi:hypothetical protein